MSDGNAIASATPPEGPRGGPAHPGAMILSCPVCGTRYRVDETVLGGTAGREVRCASCGKSWHYSPAAVQAAIAGSAATVAPAPAMPPPNESTDPPPLAEAAPAVDGPMGSSRPSVAVEMPRQARRSWFRFAWLGLVVIVAAAAFVAFIGRHALRSHWPAAGRVHSPAQLAAVPGDGLKVTVTPTRTTDALVINGSIVNSAAAARQIPYLRVSLRDDRKELLASKVVAPPVAELPPGGSAHFGATFAHPSVSATGVEVTFAGD